MGSDLVSAEEARGLLEALNVAEVPHGAGWKPLAAGVIGTRNGVSIGECWHAAVTNVCAAAPALARTVIALSEERDGLRAERDRHATALYAAGFTPCDSAACNCGGWHGGHAEGLRARLCHVAQMLIAVVDAGGPMDAEAAAEKAVAAIMERDRLTRILACEGGAWAPKGWERNDFDPEAIGIAWYRSTGTGDSETPDHGDTVLWVYREPPSSLWTWEVERYDADGDNYDHVDRGDAPTALEAIEQADKAAGVERG